MPGEPPAIFGDALRRLAAAATYLYQDGARVWYATQPTVTKLAEDRAEQLKREPDKVYAELDDRIREDARKAGDFARVHAFARSAADVPDDQDARLVVLPAEHVYTKDGTSPAEVAAKTLLESRGNSPRLFRNSLVFLAADKARMQDLDEAVRRYLAWKSIVNEADVLDLGKHQRGQAETQLKAAESMVLARIPETYHWLLVPVQVNPQASVMFQAARLSGSDALAVRASKKLRSEELLVTSLGPTILRKHLDDVPLWPDGRVSVRQLVDYFATYIYLPRLAGPDVLLGAIKNGLALLTWTSESFAYADSFDDAAGRYRGLRAGQNVAVTADSAGFLVKPDIACLQLDAEALKPDVPIPGKPGAGGGTTAVDDRSLKPKGGEPIPVPAVRRFFGTVTLDPTRVGRDAGRIAEEVISHLVGQVGADVTVRLEIAADLPKGASDHVVRTVTENSRELKFDTHGFERE
jgi:hypothetical protein